MRIVMGKIGKIIKVYNKVAKLALKKYQFINYVDINILDYSENATYLVTEKKNSHEKYILRVCRPNYRIKEEIEGEIQWLNYLLKNTTINIIEPILGSNGEYVQTVTLKNGQQIHSILFNFISGEMPDIHNENHCVSLFKKIGMLSAELHLYSIDNWEKFNRIKRPLWDFDRIIGENPIWGRWQDGLGMTVERLDLFQRVAHTIEKRLETFGKSKERFGLIHADLRHANFLVDKRENITVIDFDDSGFGWYLYDLASSLSFIEHRTYVDKLIANWIDGYRKVRTLTEGEIIEIPTFIMLRRLQLIS